MLTTNSAPSSSRPRLIAGLGFATLGLLAFLSATSSPPPAAALRASYDYSYSYSYGSYDYTYSYPPLGSDTPHPVYIEGRGKTAAQIAAEVYQALSGGLPAAMEKISLSASPATGVPTGRVGIKSKLHDEWMYAGQPMYDSDRRFVFTWDSKGSPTSERDMRWIIEKFDGFYGIKSELHNEWLYAGNLKFDNDRRHVFTWQRKGSPANEKDMRWIIEPIPGKPGEFGIQSMLHTEWLYAGNPKKDGTRRYVFTWGKKDAPAGLNGGSATDMPFYIEKL